jgi:hypothetical protein
VGSGVYNRRAPLREGKGETIPLQWQHWPINRATWESERRLREDMDSETLDRMTC